MGGQESINKDMIEFKNHQRVGIYRHLQYNGDNFIQIYREIPNQKIFNLWMENIKDVKLSMVGSDVVFLPIKQVYNKTQFCGSGGTLRIVFEEWENFLKDQIANRRKYQNIYTEEEIWFILYSLAKVGLLYEGKDVKLGDMHPNNIVVTPQGFIRVITKDSLPLQLNNFQKIVQQIKTDVYLGTYIVIVAPQEMDQSMIQSGVYSVKQPSKADVFSFGVTMLQTITLENCSYLYIRNPLRISLEKLELYTNLMKERYSIQIYNVIISALEKKPEKRISFLQIYEMLRPHEQKILEMQPFSLKGSQVKGQVEKQLSISQSRIPEQSRSMNGSVKAPVSPPTQQYFGFNKRK